MEKITGKRELFTPEELDLIVCALLRYSAELRSRSRLIERFADPKHVQSHKAKIALTERLLEDLS